MAGLEGTVKTPFGHVQKKTALALGGAAVVIAGIVYWREKGTTGNASATGEIDPATGYVYGTPEDLAALQSQGTDLGGSVGGVAGGGSAIPTGGTGSIAPGAGFTSNGQWVQAVIQYVTDNALVEDPSKMSAALGKYVTGAYIDPNDTADISLIQQAIAVQGYPPIAGANGYPPAINTHPATTTPPVTTPPPPTTISPTPIPTPTPVAPVRATLPKRRYVIVVKYTSVNPPWNSTLSGIAGRAHRTVAQLATWNHITNPNLIYVGQKIWIDPTTGYSGEIRFYG
jgi:hypothetical protein